MFIKKLLRPIVSNGVALIITSYLVEGFVVDFAPMVVGIGSLVLGLVNFFVKPILKVISFPINLATLGFFSFVINVVLLYMTIYFVDGISAQSGVFSLNFMGLVIPEIQLSALWTLVVASAIIGAINWVLKKVLF